VTTNVAVRYVLHLHTGVCEAAFVIVLLTVYSRLKTYLFNKSFPP